MQDQHNKSSEWLAKFLEQDRLKKNIINELDKKNNNIFKENIKLKGENVRLKNANKELTSEINASGNKYSNVLVQLQMLHFLGILEELKSKGTLEQRGIFFSALFNRNPQRARRHFSAIYDLTFSKNKSKAKLIKRDLEKVDKLFNQLNLPACKNIKKAIQKIDKEHMLENL
ncbi:MAG: hypothetical protein WKF85_15335 [Chitinophagaceae bacterium]